MHNPLDKNPADVADFAGRVVEAPAGLPVQIEAVKGAHGRFRVTPVARHVLVRVPAAGDEWITLYVTTLQQQMRRRRKRFAGSSSPLSPEEWVRTAQPGDEYPFEDSSLIDGLAFSQRRGGVITKKVQGGLVYARVGTDASDPQRGADAQRLLDHWRELRKTYPRLTKFHIISHRHAVFREGGRLRFICTLEAGLEFPDEIVGGEP
jgi:hypothetical protein